MITYSAAHVIFYQDIFTSLNSRHFLNFQKHHLNRLVNMELEMDDCVHMILNEFQRSDITLIEWETPLLRRLGYPLAPKPDLIFLVPGEQIQEARRIVEGNGLRDNNRRPSYLSEHANKGFRYVHCDEGHRLILVPLSWTGIKQHELVPLDSSALPCSLWTVPMPSLCAAYLRIITAAERGSIARAITVSDLTAVVVHSMFDSSYEGDYMPLPEDEDLDLSDEEKARWAKKDAMELEAAIKSINQWYFSEGTEWAKDMIIDTWMKCGLF
ncbi:hypothetical protein FAUST_3077 [Fusarium austroamericanum]|uniref:Uncharacterized protein n=1 Tax=Fusarium austroamericanum TaxID=282268 RepID=A0AAN6C5M0_FUSAU|nr:hypothetical protein FAUST_3077 [Fusarium austroamericanum]